MCSVARTMTLPDQACLPPRLPPEKQERLHAAPSRTQPYCGEPDTCKVPIESSAIRGRKNRQNASDPAGCASGSLVVDFRQRRRLQVGSTII